MFVNDTLHLDGFFTQQLWLQGQSMPEIEKRLGFHAGRLKEGCIILAAIKVPEAGDFEFAGYSQVAAHKTAQQYGSLNQTSNKSEADAYAIRKKNVMAGWGTYGQSRLIKILPGIRHNSALTNDYQYPPGTGIPQWKLVKQVAFKVINILAPAEYPNGRFIPAEGYTQVHF